VKNTVATTLPREQGVAGNGAAVQRLARRSARWPQRRFAVGGLVIVVAIVYLVVSSFSSAVQSVVSPGQLLRHGPSLYGQTVRLQGSVVGSVAYSKTTLAHVFRVAGGHAAVLVSYGGDLPGGFKTGAAVEAQGTYNGHLFTASTLTAKCPTKYAPQNASPSHQAN
jgi:cytochrome c-type biogenesis protein CcmE